MQYKRLFIVSLCALLSACAPITPNNNTDIVDESSSSISSSTTLSSQRETRNVSYTGIVKPAGISIYMEGTHRLELADGRFILLESNRVDLNGYVNEEIEALGSIRPTSEADAIIMNVSDVNLIVSSEESESSVNSLEDDSVLSSSESSSSETNTSSIVSIETESSFISSEVVISSSSSEEESTSSQEVSSFGFEHTAEYDARIVSMSENDFTSSNWTQKYCTGHIGFCVPVHRNWWYQSFGATSSENWHVEMSSEPLDKLNDGPIAVRLIPSSISGTGKSNGDIVTEGSKVIGYREWNNNSHFEITADLRLESAVSFITDQLSVYIEE